MKMMVSASVVLLAVTSLGAEAQGTRLQEQTQIELPDFGSPEKAAAWGKARLADAEESGDDRNERRLLMQAVSALKIARDWEGVAVETRVDAAAAAAEAFLRLSAPRNVVVLAARIAEEDVTGSAAGAALWERVGEAKEMLGSQRDALSSYEKGLKASPGAEWKSLLLYRAGLVAVTIGSLEKGAAYLEEAATMIPETNRRTSVVRLLLGQAYSGLKDRSRAEAWLTRASRSLDSRAKGGRVDVTGLRTFVHEPADDVLRAKIAEAETAVRNL